MKKLLALGLSLAMMASLSAVAFAATDHQITKDDPDPENALVQTPLDATQYESFLINIPATTTIDWGADAGKQIAATASGHILAGSTLTITAAPTDGDSNMYLDGDDSKSTFITYSLSGETVAEFNGTTLSNDAATFGPTVTVTDWNKPGLQPGVYTGSVTFTADFQSAAV